MSKKRDERARRAEQEREAAPLFLATCDTLNHLMDEDSKSLDPWHAIGKKVQANVMHMQEFLEARGRDNEDPYWVRHMRNTIDRYKRERVGARGSPVPQPRPLTREQIESVDAATAFEI